MVTEGVTRISVPDAKAKVKELASQKDALEGSISEITERLNSGPNPPGISGPLVDKQGFPRADIDLLAVRQDRQRLICLTNDHKALMKQLDEALVTLHAAARQEKERASPQEPSGPRGAAAVAQGATHSQTAADGRSTGDVEMKDPQQQQQQQQQQHPQAAGVQQAQGAGVAANGTGGAGGAPRPVLPFALIDEVSLGSPAASAGLAVGDQLCSFGPVGDTSAAGSAQPTLQDVAQVLSSHEGQAVAVVVLRQGQPVSLTLTPQRWSGRGLLGCHLRPL